MTTTVNVPAGAGTPPVVPRATARNAPDCIYGDTGSTKTSRLGDAAEYLYELTGKPVRYVGSDTGGWDPIQPLVDDGLIQVFPLTRRRTHLIEDMHKISMGWWPVGPDPVFRWDAEIVKPTREQIERFSGLFIEGGTSWCGMMMEVHESSVKMIGDTLQATDVRVPEMPKDSFIRSGEFVRRFTGRSDYGGVQGRAAEFIKTSAGLPFKVIWTFLESQGSDEQKRPTYGPDFIGKALTGVCGPWFGNMIHMDFLPVEVESVDPRTGARFKTKAPRPFMFLRPHTDPDDSYKLSYPAKVRAPRTLWARVPDVMEPDLGKLYRMLDSLVEEERRLRVAGAPGAK